MLEDTLYWSVLIGAVFAVRRLVKWLDQRSEKETEKALKNVLFAKGSLDSDELYRGVLNNHAGYHYNKVLQDLCIMGDIVRKSGHNDQGVRYHLSKETLSILTADVDCG